MNNFGFHGNYIFLILKLPFNQQKLLMNDHEMIFLIDLGRNNGVGNACFIFQAEKNKTLCSAGSLAGNHSSGYANMHSVWQAT